jgi:hypothetical protein
MNQSTLFKAWRLSSVARMGTIWDVHTINETWHVERVNGNAMKSLDAPAILFETGAGAPVIPPMDSAFVESGGAGTTWMESALVRSIVFKTPSGKGMDVDIEYSTRYFEADDARGMTGEDYGSATTLSRGLFLPCACLPIFQNRSMRRYQDNPGMTSPSYASDAVLNIGGTRVDFDQDVRQIGFKLRFINDTNSLTMLGTPSVDGMVDVAQACIGYKNSQTFLGQPAGAIYCSGCTVNHLEGEFFEFVLEFLYDEYYFHSQVVTKDKDGRPQMSGSAYANVDWRRTARTGVDFNSIWPAGDLGKSQKYQAFAGRWY